jgi:enamine deaminase RidA (YjgF/YER057c/UK114 family)
MNASPSDRLLPSARLAQLGLTLPSAAQPSFTYVSVVIEGSLAFVSGQLPKVDGEMQSWSNLSPLPSSLLFSDS